MKKVWFIYLLLAVGLLFSGCSNSKSLGVVCNDNTEFIVRPPLDGQMLCYDVKGSINLIIINNGDTQIRRFNFTLSGTQKDISGSIKKVFRPGDIELVNLNYNKKLIGNIEKLTIMPIITYEGKDTECKTNKFISYEIRECEG